MMRKYILTGMPGAGKTFWGAQLAKMCNIPFFDLDHLIEKKHGSISKIINKSENHFRSIEKDSLDLLLKNLSGEEYVLATGGGTLMDDESLNRVITEGIVVFINSPLENLLRNLRRDSDDSRPLLSLKHEILLKEQLLKMFYKRKAKYMESHIITRIESPEQLELFTKRLELFTKLK